MWNGSCPIQYHDYLVNRAILDNVETAKRMSPFIGVEIILLSCNVVTHYMPVHVFIFCLFCLVPFLVGISMVCSCASAHTTSLFLLSLPLLTMMCSLFAIFVFIFLFFDELGVGHPSKLKAYIL